MVVEFKSLDGKRNAEKVRRKVEAQLMTGTYHAQIRATWASFMRKWGEKRDELIEQGTRIGVESQLIDVAIATLDRAHPEYENVGRHLLHGDYTPEHILLSEGGISGVIDFENCLSDDPAYDFAWWDYFRGDELPVAWLIEGYGDAPSSLARRMTLAKLHLALGFVEYYSITKNPRGIQLTRRHLVQRSDPLARSSQWRSRCRRA